MQFFVMIESQLTLHFFPELKQSFNLQLVEWSFRHIVLMILHEDCNTFSLIQLTLLHILVLMEFS